MGPFNYFPGVTWAFFHRNSIFVPHDLRLRYTHSKAWQHQSAAAVHCLVCKVLTQPRASPCCSKKKKKEKKKEESGLQFRYYY